MKKLLICLFMLAGTTIFASNSINPYIKKSVATLKNAEKAFITCSASKDGTTYSVSCVCNAQECKTKLIKAMDQQ